MTDYITNAILSKVGQDLDYNLGVNIMFRESPTFNFSKEMKNAISTNTIYQDIYGDKKAMMLAIYNRSGIRITDKGIRQSVRKNHRFKEEGIVDYGMEKRFITSDWNIQVRVACSIRDIMEGVELNYHYWIKPLSHTYVGIEIEGVEKPIYLQYTTEFEEGSNMDYADFPNYGAMYILSFNIGVTGDLFLPQNTYYPKIKRITDKYYVGTSKEEAERVITGTRIFEYAPEQKLVAKEYVG